MSELINHESTAQRLKIGRVEFPLSSQLCDLFAYPIVGDITRQDEIASITIISVMDGCEPVQTEVFPQSASESGRFHSRAVSRHGPVSVKFDPETGTVKVNSYKQVHYTTLAVEIKAWP